jgi:glycerol-3-phosphate acyltransferase PlsY
VLKGSNARITIILFLVYVAVWFVLVCRWAKVKSRNKFIGFMILGPLVYMPSIYNRVMAKWALLGWKAGLVDLLIKLKNNRPANEAVQG